MNKFKKFFLLSALILIGVLVFKSNGLTTPFPNPDPSSLGNDLDDPGVFMYSDPVITVEVFDLGEADTGVGNTFGFFFEDNPTNIFTIFDPLDTNSQLAVIDFTAGIVFDTEDDAVQDTFTGSGNIGFFLTPDPAYGLGTLYTIPSLNQGGEDLAATFPILGSDDYYIIGFYYNDVPFGLELCMGVTPVPEPCTFLLFILSLIGFVGFRKQFM